jgi:hypothetical protein
MNRWQHFYDMAAAQFAAFYVQNRTASDEERASNAARYAASARVFADAFVEAESKALKTQPPTHFITERGGDLDLAHND